MKTKTEVKEKEDIQQVKLKRLLKQPESQELGDTSIWEKTPGIEIALLKYLGQNLNKATLERLNKEPNAWEAVIAVDYFAKKAQEENNIELKEDLLKLINNPDISAQDIAIYATKSLEGTLDKEDLKQSLLECQKTIETFNQKSNIESIEENLDQKVNTIDIVLLPTDKENSCIYVKKPVLDGTLDNIVVNIHGIGDRDENIINKALMITEPYLNSIFPNGSYIDIPGQCGRIISGGILGGGGIGICAGILASSALLGSGIFLGILGGSIYGAFLYRKKSKLAKKRKKIQQMQKFVKEKLGPAIVYLDNENIHWHNSKELENMFNGAYNKTFLGREKCQDTLLKKAIIYLWGQYELGKLEVDAPLIATYKSKIHRHHRLDKISRGNR